MDIVSLIFKANTSDLDKAERKLGDIGVAASNAEDKVDGLTTAMLGVRSVGGPLGEVASQLDDMRDRAQGAVDMFKGLGANAIAASSALFVLVGAAGAFAAVRFTDMLDDLGDLATKLGLSTTQALLLKQEMDDAGVSVEAYQTALQRAAVALNKSDEEGKKAAVALETLGISAKDASTPQELLTAITEKYAEKVRGGTLSVGEMVSLQAVLGKSYRESMIAQEANSAAQERYNSFAQAGVGISADGEKATGEFINANKDMGVVLQSVGSVLVAKIVPAFTALIGQLVESYKNGGLVKSAFEVVGFAANAVMIPIRALVQVFIGLDTTINTVGKSIGALFAAIATRSTQPFKELQTDIDRLWNDAAKKLEQAKLWGSDSGEVTGPKSMQVDPGKQNKPTKEPKVREPKEHKEKYTYKDDGYRDARIQRETPEHQQRVNELIGKYIKEEEALRQRKIQAVDREIAQYQQQIALATQDNAVNRIANEIYADRSKTQDDLNVAVAQYNLSLAQSALNTAMQNGADAESLRLLQAKVDTQRELLGLSVERKSDNEGARDLEKSRSFLDGMKDGYKQLDKLMLSSAQMGERAFITMAERSSDAFADFVTTGKFNFKEFARSFLADIAKMIAKQMMLNALKSMMGGFFADGGAFSGGVQFFANGGVVNRPTGFGMAGGKMGVMGEAGPEAIMPLKRGSNGQLGVQMHGGSGAQTVNNSITVNVGSVDSTDRIEELKKSLQQTIVTTSKAVLFNEMRKGNALSPVR